MLLLFSFPVPAGLKDVLSRVCLKPFLSNFSFQPMTPPLYIRSNRTRDLDAFPSTCIPIRIFLSTYLRIWAMTTLDVSKADSEIDYDWRDSLMSFLLWEYMASNDNPSLRTALSSNGPGRLYNFGTDQAR